MLMKGKVDRRVGARPIDKWPAEKLCLFGYGLIQFSSGFMGQLTDQFASYNRRCKFKQEVSGMETWQRIRNVGIIVLAIMAVWSAARSYGQTQAAPFSAILVPSGHIGAVKFASVSGKSVAQASVSPASDSSGWVDIMPHGSLQGWTRLAIPPGKALDPVSQWKLGKDPATIICEGNHGHEWLRYDRELTNFLLHVEWRFEKREGLEGYNSGVFVRNDLEGRIWHQAQVGPQVYIFGQTMIHGVLSAVIKTPPPAVNPLHAIGEWNTYEIRCDGPKITLWVNGDLSGEFAAPEVPKGYWGLEAEGYRIEFRNIKLKSLP
jgi:hypothetical protein